MLSDLVQFIFFFFLFTELFNLTFHSFIIPLVVLLPTNPNIAILIFRSDLTCAGGTDFQRKSLLLAPITDQNCIFSEYINHICGIASKSVQCTTWPINLSCPIKNRGQKVDLSPSTEEQSWNPHERSLKWVGLELPTHSILAISSQHALFLFSCWLAFAGSFTGTDQQKKVRFLRKGERQVKLKITLIWAMKTFHLPSLNVCFKMLIYLSESVRFKKIMYYKNKL